jgi:hypothetical protein
MYCGRGYVGWVGGVELDGDRERVWGGQRLGWG